MPCPMPTSSTRSRCPTGKRPAICSSSWRATSSRRMTWRSAPWPADRSAEPSAQPETSVLRAALRA
ncbi:hypothetical protein CU044_3717 [Streptomyces sp. L-9-10]|nr:hypothetical protein CU044_3717 [Streptomyces sp. L-9-10]